MIRKDILQVIRKWTVHNYWPEIVNMDGNRSFRIPNLMNVSQHMEHKTFHISHLNRQLDQ